MEDMQRDSAVTRSYECVVKEHVSEVQVLLLVVKIDSCTRWSLASISCQTI